ncbi:MAG: anthranilate synthase component I [Actinobacteria bacterium]|uniref:Anthranilate synthase component 1 n=1 Tax=freshwater metagenome TaxID=449393 RepID=A0A6J6PI12_9ZZZZ|nr:anthranilate synthase component I [Actinomycetota bacterium]
MTTTATELHTDLLTPLAAYLRLRGRGQASFLLESVDQGRLGRYSLLGCGSRIVDVHEAERLNEPVVGHVGYDWIAELEPTVPLPEPGRGLPVSQFVVADILVRFDHVRGVSQVLRGDPNEVRALLDAPIELPSASTDYPSRPIVRTPSQAEHEARVEKAKEYIRAGDAFQIVVAQRAERATSASALAIYRALRRVNPSPYLFLLELGDTALIGSSPETHVKLEGTRASLNPIAGTTPVGEGDAERLLASEKDRAEHVMLVDLGRNDLSRVCKPGTVRVERFLQVERFSHVTHLVSEVAGEIEEGYSPWDLLRATFPAGTVSGAPKVRAMQIISELEGFRRGFYAGVVGYHIPGVGLDTCIALRTMLLHDGVAHLQAGGGLVVDSNPTDEHNECLNKLAAIERAIDLAESEAS